MGRLTVLTGAVFLTLLVIVMASDLKAEEKISIVSDSQIAAESKIDASSLQPHKRSKRTIGHIFDMFKNMMDGLFGGGKKKKRPRRPGGYGAPRPQAPKPSYGRPNPPPRPPRPPPPPRNPPPNLSGGYASGNRPQPPRAPRPPPRPQAPNPDSYGSPVAPPVPNNPDSYGSPIAPPVPQAPNPDSYGSPQASPVGPSYSAQPQPAPPAPRAPAPGPSDQFGPSSVFYMIPAPNLATEAPGGGAAAAAPAGGDTYGSPQAAPVGGDTYGSPQSAPVGGGGAAPDSYSGPDSYNAQPAPAPSDYSSNLPAVPQAPRQENPFISQYNNAAPLPVIENNDLSGQFVEEADAYGAPAGGDVAPEPITDIDTPEGGEVVITSDFDVDIGDLASRDSAVVAEDLIDDECTTGDVVDVAVGAGSFTTLTKIVTDLGLVDTLKSVEAVTIFAPTDDAFAALPEGLLAGLTQDQVAAVVSRHVVAGATVMAADVATGEVETFGGEMIGLIKTEDGGVQISKDGQIVNVVTADIKACNGVIHVIDAVIVGGGGEEEAEALADGLADDYSVDLRNDAVVAPEGEIESLNTEEEGAQTPLFEDLRNVAFTSPDEYNPTTEALSELEPIQIDLSDGVADFTNGLDADYSPEVDLTLKSEDTLGDYDYSQGLDYETTPVPSFDDIVDDVEYYDDTEYIGDEDVPPELPEDLTEDLDLRSDTIEDDLAANALEGDSESFGQPEASDNTDSDSDYEYEYYYDYEEDYEVDPEQKAEDLQDTYSPAYSPGGPAATEAAPLTTAADPGGIIEEVVPLEEEEANFISVPLMIEEVSDQDAAPVILAGTSGDQLLSTYGGGDNKLNSKRRAPHAFHPVFQGWNLNTASDQNTQSKRQSDWSQRVASARRNRVWRQFNLD